MGSKLYGYVFVMTTLHPSLCIQSESLLHIVGGMFSDFVVLLLVDFLFRVESVVVETATVCDFSHVYIRLHLIQPSRHMALIQHRLNVAATSWRCIDVEPTLYKRHVPARKGIHLVDNPPCLWFYKDDIYCDFLFGAFLFWNGVYPEI